MSNINKLVGIGQELLVNSEGEIIAELIDGNFSQKVLVGNNDDTVVLRSEDDCTCDDCFDHESPCKGECGECQGCREKRDDMLEMMFEIGAAQGRF